MNGFVQHIYMYPSIYTASGHPAVVLLAGANQYVWLMAKVQRMCVFFPGREECTLSFFTTNMHCRLKANMYTFKNNVTSISTHKKYLLI